MKEKRFQLLILSPLKWIWGISVKEITKLENTSLSDFKLHTEECKKACILPLIVCAAVSGMTGRMKEYAGHGSYPLMFKNDVIDVHTAIRYRLL